MLLFGIGKIDRSGRILVPVPVPVPVFIVWFFVVLPRSYAIVPAGPEVRTDLTQLLFGIVSKTNKCSACL